MHCLPATQLAQYGDEHNLWKGHKLEQLDTAVNCTFGSLEGAKLIFPKGHSPFKRCLSFHAQRAVSRAMGQGWLARGWQPSDHTLEYMAEDGGQLPVQTWLQNADSMSLPVPSATPSE